MTTLADLGSEQFVSLTTFRRNGEGVATPVWVAPTGAALVATTGATTGKVKRIRRDPRATLRPCTRTGQVAPDAPEVAARVELVDDPAEVRRLTRAVLAKYGLLARVLLTVERLGRRRRRVVLRLTPAPAG